MASDNCQTITVLPVANQQVGGYFSENGAILPETREQGISPGTPGEGSTIQFARSNEDEPLTITLNSFFSGHE